MSLKDSVHTLNHTPSLFPHTRGTSQTTFSHSAAHPLCFNTLGEPHRQLSATRPHILSVSTLSGNLTDNFQPLGRTPSVSTLSGNLTDNFQPLGRTSSLFPHTQGTSLTTFGHSAAHPPCISRGSGEFNFLYGPLLLCLSEL